MLIIRSADQTEAGSAGAQPARDNRLEFRQNNAWGLALRSRSRFCNNIPETFPMPIKNSSRRTPRRGSLVAYIKQAFVQFPLNQHKTICSYTDTFTIEPYSRILLIQHTLQSRTCIGLQACLNDGYWGCTKVLLIPPTFKHIWKSLRFVSTDAHFGIAVWCSGD